MADAALNIVINATNNAQRAIEQILKSVQGLNSNLQNIRSDAGERLAAGFKDTGKNAKEASDNVRGLTAQVKELAESADSLKEAMRGAMTLFLGREFIDFFDDLAREAGRTGELAIALKVIGNNAGYTNAQLKATTMVLNDMGIATVDAEQGLTRLIQAGLKLNDAAPLARLAQDMAVISGEGSSATFTRLLENIEAMSEVGLRYQGIIINRTRAEEEYARTHNTTANALSISQQREAFYNATVAQGVVLMGAYQQAMTNAEKQRQSISDRVMKDAKDALGQGLQPAYLALVQVTTEFLTDLREMVEGFNEAGNGAEQFGAYVREVAEAVKNSIEWLIEHKRVVEGVAVAWAGYKLLGVASGIGEMVTNIGVLTKSLKEMRLAATESFSSLAASARKGAIATKEAAASTAGSAASSSAIVTSAAGNAANTKLLGPNGLPLVAETGAAEGAEAAAIGAAAGGLFGRLGTFARGVLGLVTRIGPLLMGLGRLFLRMIPGVGIAFALYEVLDHFDTFSNGVKGILAGIGKSWTTMINTIANGGHHLAQFGDWVANKMGLMPDDEYAFNSRERDKQIAANNAEGEKALEQARKNLMAGLHGESMTPKGVGSLPTDQHGMEDTYAKAYERAQTAALRLAELQRLLNQTQQQYLNAQAGVTANDVDHMQHLVEEAEKEKEKADTALDYLNTNLKLDEADKAHIQNLEKQKALVGEILTYANQQIEYFTKLEQLSGADKLDFRMGDYLNKDTEGIIDGVRQMLAARRDFNAYREKALSRAGELGMNPAAIDAALDQFRQLVMRFNETELRYLLTTARDKATQGAELNMLGEVVKQIQAGTFATGVGPTDAQLKELNQNAATQVGMATNMVSGINTTNELLQNIDNHIQGKQQTFPMATGNADNPVVHMPLPGGTASPAGFDVSLSGKEIGGLSAAAQRVYKDRKAQMDAYDLQLMKLGFPKGTTERSTFIESHFNANAVGRPTKYGQALGLTQLMPMNLNRLGQNANWRDPAQSLAIQHQLLLDYYNEFHDVNKALAALNAGPSAVRHFRGVPPFKETGNWLAKFYAAANGNWSGSGTPHAGNVPGYNFGLLGIGPDFLNPKMSDAAAKTIADQMGGSGKIEADQTVFAKKLDDELEKQKAKATQDKTLNDRVRQVLKGWMATNLPFKFDANTMPQALAQYNGRYVAEDLFGKADREMTASEQQAQEKIAKQTLDNAIAKRNRSLGYNPVTGKPETYFTASPFAKQQGLNSDILKADEALATLQKQNLTALQAKQLAQIPQQVASQEFYHGLLGQRDQAYGNSVMAQVRQERLNAAKQFAEARSHGLPIDATGHRLTDAEMQALVEDVSQRKITVIVQKAWNDMSDAWAKAVGDLSGNLNAIFNEGRVSAATKIAQEVAKVQSLLGDQMAGQYQNALLGQYNNATMGRNLNGMFGFAGNIVSYMQSQNAVQNAQIGPGMKGSIYDLAQQSQQALQLAQEYDYAVTALEREYDQLVKNGATLQQQMEYQKQINNLRAQGIQELQKSDLLGNTIGKDMQNPLTTLMDQLESRRYVRSSTIFRQAGEQIALNLQHTVNQTLSGMMMKQLGLGAGPGGTNTGIIGGMSSWFQHLFGLDKKTTGPGGIVQGANAALGNANIMNGTLTGTDIATAASGGLLAAAPGIGVAIGQAAALTMQMGSMGSGMGSLAGTAASLMSNGWAGSADAAGAMASGLAMEAHGGLIGRLRYLARGGPSGPVSGPGGPTDDRIPAMLSNGEFVVNARSTSRFLPLLHAINSGNVMRHFAVGGPALKSMNSHSAIGTAAKAMVAGNQNNVGVTVNMNGGANPSVAVTGNSQQGQQLGRAIQGAIVDEIVRQQRPGGVLYNTGR